MIPAALIAGTVILLRFAARVLAFAHGRYDADLRDYRRDYRADRRGAVETIPHRSEP